MQFKHRSTKRYGHNSGFSCCFRQPNATHSHCSLLHGYALSFELVFGTESLDDKNWVQDFGGLKEVKKFLEAAFDHTLAIDEDDPNLNDFMVLQRKGLADVRILPGVGCEKFAEFVFENVERILELGDSNSRVQLISVQCWEHEANSALFINPRI